MRKAIPLWLLVCLLISSIGGVAQAETIFTLTTMIASSDAVEAGAGQGGAADVFVQEAATTEDVAITTNDTAENLPARETAHGVRPEIPREVRIIPQNSALAVTWYAAAPGMEEDPVIKYVITLDGDAQRVIIAAGDALSHTFEGLLNGRMYEIAVTAVAQSGESSNRVAFEAMPGITSEPTGAPPEGIPAKVVCGKAVADIRKGPGTSYPITDGVPPGDDIYIQETHGEWVQVLYASGTRAGWMHENNVDED